MDRKTPKGVLSVLLVEDDAADAKLASIQLSRLAWASVSVDHATTLEKARELLNGARTPYDLVVADLELPDSSGLGTIEALVSLRLDMPPVIAHTGHAELGREAVRVGADDYVVKGSERDRFVHAVRYAVGRARQRADLRAVIDGNQDAMLVVDRREHRILFANAASHRFFGEGAIVLGEAFAFHADAKSTTEFDVQRGGETFNAEMRTTPIEWDGEPGLLHCVRDVTDRTRALEYEHRLEHANRLAAIGQLAAGVAHEVNNPAAFILANLEHMREQLSALANSEDRAFDDTQLTACEHMLNDCVEGTLRIASIVKELRAFARTEADDDSLVDVNELIEVACRMATNEVRHRATMVLDLGVVPAVRADKSQVSQIVLNLLINAAQAIAPGNVERNRVEVRSRYRDGQVLISVEDTGVGIPEHIVPRVFDPFFTTKPRDLGTGLGLAICAETVRKLDGEIHLFSEEGRGTRVEITLPAEDGKQARRTASSSQPGPIASKKRARILLVDDDPMIRRAFRRLLRGAHDSTEAVDGDDALKHLERCAEYDVILCDLMMPRMDGPALYEQVCTKLPQLAERFVFISGGAFSESTQSFIERHRPLVLPKPVAKDALLRTIDSYL